VRPDTPLLGLKNVGPTIAARLRSVGLQTVGDLRRIGAAEAYKRVVAGHPDVTIPVCYYLYSLEGRSPASIGMRCLPASSGGC
jgi:DNA transformation protein